MNLTLTGWKVHAWSQDIFKEMMAVNNAVIQED